MCDMMLMSLCQQDKTSISGHKLVFDGGSNAIKTISEICEPQPLDGSGVSEPACFATSALTGCSPLFHFTMTDLVVW